jgi:hypothetical protein
LGGLEEKDISKPSVPYVDEAGRVLKEMLKKRLKN